MKVKLLKALFLPVSGACLTASLASCNLQKPAQDVSVPPDPNVIETKLADGKVLHYTRQQLDEAKSWGYTKDVYESNLAAGDTHGALIETAKRHYWERVHGVGFPTPVGGITPPK